MLFLPPVVSESCAQFCLFVVVVVADTAVAVVADTAVVVVVVVAADTAVAVVADTAVVVVVVVAADTAVVVVVVVAADTAVAVVAAHCYCFVAGELCKLARVTGPEFPHPFSPVGRCLPATGRCRAAV